MVCSWVHEMADTEEALMIPPTIIQYVCAFCCKTSEGCQGCRVLPKAKGLMALFGALLLDWLVPEVSRTFVGQVMPLRALALRSQASGFSRVRRYFFTVYP